MKALRYFFQYTIALTLLIAAIGKLLDNRFAAGLFAQWQIFPNWSYLVLPLIASLSELGLSLWLFSGKALPRAALLSVIFHGTYTLLTVITLLRGIRLPDCGCFGILYAHPLDWVMAVEDAAYVFCSFVLYLIAKREREDRFS
ncbi:MAG: hypothetical protein HYZ71_12530 [Deltaproteobacteria bacterium]|nr:hypothetical protein [Deltaproteobacteria bacterium]